MRTLHDLGWDDDWVLDLGGISTARGTEAMALMVPGLLGAIGFVPFALTVARCTPPRCPTLRPTLTRQG